MARKLRVAVLYGGRSAEHEISLQSAATVIGGLDPSRYIALPVLIDRPGRWWLKRSGGRTEVLLGHKPELISKGGRAQAFDLAIPVVHGSRGEDGCLQGALELAGAPYVGSNVFGSALGMDKPASKLIAQSAGLRVPADVVVRAGEPLAPALRAARKLGLPLFVKPAAQGSSVGVRKVKRWSELEPALRFALKFDSKAMAEQAVEGGFEVSVAVLGDESSAKASKPGAIRAGKAHDFYSYEAKYIDPEGHELTIPAPLSAAKTKEVQAAAVKAFQALGCYGMARVDFLLDKKGTLFFGEVNTIPGFTSHSLYPALWKASGLPLPRLLDKLIALALKRSRAASKLLIKPD